MLHIKERHCEYISNFKIDEEGIKSIKELHYTTNMSHGKFGFIRLFINIIELTITECDLVLIYSNFKIAYSQLIKLNIKLPEHNFCFEDYIEMKIP